jgi:hypothetical protein
MEAKASVKKMMIDIERNDFRRNDTRLNAAPPILTSVDPPEVYVAHPLNALGVLKRTGFDYFNSFRTVVDENYNAVAMSSKLFCVGNDGGT